MTKDEPQTCVVIAEYQAAYPDPLIMRAEEVLTIGERESEWRGWLWCTNQQGESRWVPEAFVEQRGVIGVMLCDYDSTELSVHVGEELAAEQETADWFWCTNRKGQRGWVPKENLDCRALE